MYHPLMLYRVNPLSYIYQTGNVLGELSPLLGHPTTNAAVAIYRHISIYLYLYLYLYIYLSIYIYLYISIYIYIFIYIYPVRDDAKTGMAILLGT